MHTNTHTFSSPSSYFTTASSFSSTIEFLIFLFLLLVVKISSSFLPFYTLPHYFTHPYLHALEITSAHLRSRFLCTTKQMQRFVLTPLTFQISVLWSLTVSFSLSKFLKLTSFIFLFPLPFNLCDSVSVSELKHLFARHHHQPHLSVGPRKHILLLPVH